MNESYVKYVKKSYIEKLKIELEKAQKDRDEIKITLILSIIDRLEDETRDEV